ncbi:MAG: OmpA family protein [Desulfovibrionaceae bacterium]
MHAGYLGRLTLAMMLTMVLAVPALAEEVMVRKVDNVFFVADISGSMWDDYQGTDTSKVELTKELIKRFADRMPSLKYKTAVHQFSDFHEWRKLADHEQDVFELAADSIAEKGSYEREETPIGDGLFEMAWPISEARGPVALILFTDGGNPTGKRPVPMARELYRQFDICIHVVSFAQDAEEYEVVRELAEINPCSFVAQAEQLLSDPVSMDAFVKNATWDLRTVHRNMPVAAAEPEPERVYKTMDMELNVEFDFDKSDIRPEYHDDLDKLGTLLKENDTLEVLIVGHTDNKGTYVYNIGLSQRRADAMKQYVVDAYGIDPKRIDTVGYSFTQPVATNDTAEGRQKNRRALARITGWHQQ